MEKWIVCPTLKLNKIDFSMNRNEIRTIIGCAYEEKKKSLFSKNTIDVYEGYHIWYDENNVLEAIEFFSDVEVFIGEKVVFPGTIKNALSVVPDLNFDGYGYISKKFSIGITVTDDIIEGILFGKKDYYCF